MKRAHVRLLESPILTHGDSELSKSLENVRGNSIINIQLIGPKDHSGVSAFSSHKKLAGNSYEHLH